MRVLYVPLPDEANYLFSWRGRGAFKGVVVVVVQAVCDESCEVV